jgi:hypothetical protein
LNPLHPPSLRFSHHYSLIHRAPTPPPNQPQPSSSPPPNPTSSTSASPSLVPHPPAHPTTGPLPASPSQLSLQPPQPPPPPPLQHKQQIQIQIQILNPCPSHAASTPPGPATSTPAATSPPRIAGRASCCIMATVLKWGRCGTLRRGLCRLIRSCGVRHQMGKREAIRRQQQREKLLNLLNQSLRTSILHLIQRSETQT